MSTATREYLPSSEEVPYRTPPNSLEAEQGIIGCIFLAPYDCIYECITAFRDGGKEFYDLRLQVIYQEIVAMAELLEPIDTITVQQRLKDKQQLEAVGGLPFLASLPDKVPSAANLSFYIPIVVEKYALRRMIGVCTDIVGRVYEWTGQVDELIDSCEADFLGVTERQQTNLAVQCGPAVQRAMERMDTYLTDPGAMMGIATGYTDIDRLTTGLKGAELTIIAARPSMGKTSLAMNIAENVVLNQKIPVGVFSLEMSEDSLIERMICSNARVNIRNVRDGFVRDIDFPKIAAAGVRLNVAPLYIDDTAGLSILELRARARRMWAMYGIKLFIIDYLQLLHSTNRKSQNRQQEIGDISRGCKQLAKDLKVPVIVLSQLNRGIENGSPRKPRLSDLRESGDIEQDADTVGFLYNPNPEENSAYAESMAVNFLIAKQRNGPIDDVPLTFLKSITRFENAAKISDEPETTTTTAPSPLI
jgi:replicative DNA helicase